MNGIEAQHYITDNLWLGGYPQGEAPDPIKYIVCCCGNLPWGQMTRPYSLRPGQVAISTQFDDSAFLPPPDFLHGLADMVNSLRRDGPVLVHCAAGLNRSGLIAGLALVKSGMQPTDAIKLMREKRDPLVLFNGRFREWLMTQSPPSP